MNWGPIPLWCKQDPTIRKRWKIEGHRSGAPRDFNGQVIQRVRRKFLPGGSLCPSKNRLRWYASPDEPLLQQGVEWQGWLQQCRSFKMKDYTTKADDVERTSRESPLHCICIEIFAKHSHFLIILPLHNKRSRIDPRTCRRLKLYTSVRVLEGMVSVSLGAGFRFNMGSGIVSDTATVSMYGCMREDSVFTRARTFVSAPLRH